MSKNLKQRLVQSLVMPGFRYYVVFYIDNTTKLESTLQKAQNSGTRLIDGLKKFDRVSESYRELNIPRIEQIRRVSLLKLG